ncbi:craniofacial development protein 2-like [Vanessa cardui]|uniref:craniofacial development protein 2-like n=1 Tax=Vanessa cardui TaxID=171605 RepID=UPI001F147421|nr:craniofacial development protein 2-like [Vanessa cardui]
MRHKKKRLSVPGSPAILDYGSGRGNGGAEGAKNSRVTVGCQHKRLYLACYNGRTLRLEHYLAELEVELGHINWHVLGLSEVRREGEDTITLESGHLLYFRQGDQSFQGGVGFLVNKALSGSVVKVSRVSTRVAYLVLKLTDRYSLKVVQVYAPTSAHSDDEVEAMYEDITRAIGGTTTAHYNIVMGDFNAKMGVQERDELRIGPHGLGRRDHSGQMLVNFLEMQGVFLMNSFFKKKFHRRWTWQSPDSVTWNEIDFIIADKRQIFRDVSVFNRFNNGSDHRLDEFQPPEQAAFRKGYSTVDHIHTVRQIIQRTKEYNLSLCMAFVDYEKPSTPLKPGLFWNLCSDVISTGDISRC